MVAPATRAFPNEAFTPKDELTAERTGPGSTGGATVGFVVTGVAVGAMLVGGSNVGSMVAGIAVAAKVGAMVVGVDDGDEESKNCWSANVGAGDIEDALLVLGPSVGASVTGGGSPLLYLSTNSTTLPTFQKSTTRKLMTTGLRYCRNIS